MVTAEVVVMNKSAVALAADSAVTVSSGRSGMKTFDTVNKLFELVKGRGIGAMIYSNAEINGVPWEVVIKTFRRDHSDFHASYLQDYVDEFNNYLRDNVELLRPDDEYYTIINTTYSRLLGVFNHVANYAEYFVDPKGRVIRTRLHELVNQSLDSWEAAVARLEDAPWTADLDKIKLRKAFGSQINDLTADLFAEFRLPAKTLRRMLDLSVETLRKCATEPGETGLVLAGFGDRDVFPSLHRVVVRGRLLGNLRAAHPHTFAIDLEHPGFLDTFAQDEQAWGFLSGITPDVRDSVIAHWGEWAGSFAKDCLPEILPHVATRAVARKVAQAIEGLAKARLDVFLETMNNRTHDLYLTPMLDSVAALPKDEIGVLAESLVNVTLLKQRMSIYQPNTVGGAIDVAMISTGDGFVWLKRKHYFSRELNPAWHLTHSATLS